MSDRRRVVTITPAGTVTTLKDLEDGVAYFSVQDSFTVKAPQRNPIKATRNRRYGGWRTVGETHDNGEISWKMLVKGTTADQCVQNLEAALTVLESARTDLFFEWRPDGVTSSVYYEVRGPAQYTPTYSWALFLGEKAMYVDITIPVGPLAQGDKYTIAIGSTVLPNVVQLASAITGDAPALADISLRTSGGSAPVWALFAWIKRPGTSAIGGNAPFGVVEGEARTATATMVNVADANCRGGTFLSNPSISGAGGGWANWAFDPSLLDPDDFRLGEVDVEVWGRIKLSSTIVSPTIALSVEPDAGSSFGGYGYSAEYGSAGKVLTLPSTGTVYRPYKLGTLTMPVDPVTPLKWRIRTDMSWAAGSSGTFGIDYLVVVPSRARALGPTGKANDATYPDFIRSTADTTKTIRADLSGLVASAAGNQGRDTGLGGSMIELPPGNVDLLLKLASTAPDDPTIDATTEALSHTVTGTVTVTPRFWVGRGA